MIESRPTRERMAVPADTSNGKAPERKDLRLRDRAHRARPCGNWWSATDARNQAIQGQRQRTAPRHAGLHRRASDPEFLWADYTGRQAPVTSSGLSPHGTVKNATLDDAAAVMLDVTAENETDQTLEDTDDSIRHDVFFNRGVIGSQAYAREFAIASRMPKILGRRK